MSIRHEFIFFCSPQALLGFSELTTVSKEESHPTQEGVRSCPHANNNTDNCTFHLSAEHSNYSECRLKKQKVLSFSNSSNLNQTFPVNKTFTMMEGISELKTVWVGQCFWDVSTGQLSCGLFLMLVLFFSCWFTYVVWGCHLVFSPNLCNNLSQLCDTILKLLLFSQWLQDIQALREQRKPKPWRSLHHASQLRWRFFFCTSEAAFIKFQSILVVGWLIPCCTNQMCGLDIGDAQAVPRLIHSAEWYPALHHTWPAQWLLAEELTWRGGSQQQNDCSVEGFD